MKVTRKKDAVKMRIVEHNKKLLRWIIALLILLIIVVGLIRYIDNQTAKSQENLGIANPASVYCEEQDGESYIKTDSDGSQSGVCVLKSGKECDEWQYYRGECL